MQTFDLIVVGGGSGLNISSAAADTGLKVAVVEKGPMGGTCLNRGCIPSKIILHSADVIETIRKAPYFGINAKLNSVDFKKIISRSSKIVDKGAKEIEEGIREDKNTTLYKTEGRFISRKTIKVGNETIKSNKIIIAAGTRPFVPNVEGLRETDFMTSDEALRLKKQPRILTILGGGYVATEFAHFFGALGTRINMIESMPILVPNEDEEISAHFTEIFSGKYNVMGGFSAKKVSKKGGNFLVEIESNGQKRKRVSLSSDQLLVATGRTPNTDVLDVVKTGVKTDEKGYIIANDYLETSEKGIWAFGDIIGKYLFKHSANLEAGYAYQNAVMERKMKVDYSVMPHAIFTSPQIAAVGEREQDLKAKRADYAVGKYRFINSGMGTALNDGHGFVKILADRKTRKILGCHIIGTEAATLIHEVLISMKAGMTADALEKVVHIHPALSEVVQRAAGNIEW